MAGKRDKPEMIVLKLRQPAPFRTADLWPLEILR
jgi:hypothetical protein